MNPRPTTSAYNFFRRVLCPGSGAAEAGAPEQTSEFAAEGTLLHYKDAYGEAGENESQTELLERNRMLRDDFLAQTLSSMGIPQDEPRETVVESEVWVCDEHGTETILGHPDRMIYFPRFKLLFIFDSKFGRKVVPLAENNYQLRIYAVGAADPVFGQFDCDRVYAVITQPMASPQLHAALYTRTELTAAKAEVLAHHRNPDRTLNPSMEACFYCKASGTCRPALALVQQLAETKISNMPLDELEALAPRVALADIIVKAYWKKLKEIAIAHPHLLERHELGQAGENASLPLEKMVEAYTALCEGGVMTTDDFLRSCRFSIPAAVDAVAKARNLDGRQAREVVEYALSDLLDRNPRARQLVEKQL